MIEKVIILFLIKEASLNLLIDVVLLDLHFMIFDRSEVSGDREVQRTMLELLNQLDGFSSDDRIKVFSPA